MGVVVVVDDLQLELAPVREDQDSGIENELVQRNPNGGVHLAVGSLLGHSDVSASEHPSDGHPVLFRQPFNHSLIGSGSHGDSLLPSGKWAEKT
jgi:hypothetical protein